MKTWFQLEQWGASLSDPQSWGILWVGCGWKERILNCSAAPRHGRTNQKGVDAGMLRAQLNPVCTHRTNPWTFLHRTSSLLGRAQLYLGSPTTDWEKRSLAWLGNRPFLDEQKKHATVSTTYWIPKYWEQEVKWKCNAWGGGEMQGTW